jgi:hypothetical protein
VDARGRIMERVEDQLPWYDRKNMTNQWGLKPIEVVEIVAAGTIPYSSGPWAPAHRDGDERLRCTDNRV